MTNKIRLCAAIAEDVAASLGRDPGEKGTAKLTEALADPATDKRVKFTAKTRRGLATVLRLILIAADDNGLPVGAFIDGLNKARADEYNQALDWLRQEGVDPANLN